MGTSTCFPSAQRLRSTFAYLSRNGRRFCGLAPPSRPFRRQANCLPKSRTKTASRNRRTWVTRNNKKAGSFVSDMRQFTSVSIVSCAHGSPAVKPRYPQNSCFLGSLGSRSSGFLDTRVKIFGWSKKNMLEQHFARHLLILPTIETAEIHHAPSSVRGIIIRPSGTVATPISWSMASACRPYLEKTTDHSLSSMAM